MVQVNWTRPAEDDVDEIRRWIARDSSTIAEAVVERLIVMSEQMEAFPESGRMVPEFTRPDIREVIVRPYRIIYRITPSEIDILTVIHGA